MPERPAISVDSIIDESATNLSDLSERDKPWDKHRANADKVGKHYAGSEFQDYSQRINLCSQFLDFRLTPDTHGSYKLKLDSALFCRVRHCPVCQWRRSLMWKAKAYKILPQVVEAYPKYRWLFVTLTVKNCPIDQLKETLQWMHQGFKRMTKLKAFPAVGWLKSTEVTRGRRGSLKSSLLCVIFVLLILSRSQKDMGRGGYRKNAGAKPSWKHGKTKTIRVPIALADEVLRLARLLDEGYAVDINESDTSSKVLDLSSISVGKTKQQGRSYVYLDDLVFAGYQIAPQILADRLIGEIYRKQLSNGDILSAKEN